ncbi:MAG TPA: nickel-dependent lactate racemase [Candidatus Lokiarchaeia archaeon]|nr:nickel-dependent lactate racemase [Candidatus Lokiarchaeia archaeon]
MKTRIAYGKSGLEINLPDSLNVTIANPEPEGPLDYPLSSIAGAIDAPIKSKMLNEIIREKQALLGRDELSACIVVSDHTRPVPTSLLLPPLLERLELAGIATGNITILVGTGLHRASSLAEIDAMIGEDLASKYKVIIHDSKDKDALEFLGTSSRETPIWVNKVYLGADIKILTGYVDPHFFAGYAGGRKAIVPGIAGEETIAGNHSARNIDSLNARFTVLEGNPIHEDALEIAKQVGVDFIVNVCLDDQHRIVNVAAGDLEAAHDALVEHVRQTAVVHLDDYFDIVIVNNGGYPLDLNLYQAVKSMNLGELAVKEGGTIIAVNEARDGFGSDEFKAIIESESDPDEFTRKLLEKELRIDGQWQVQTLARAAKRAEILVVGSMPKAAFKNVKLGMKWAESVEKAVDQAVKKHGKQAKILILPAGPQLVPCVNESDESTCKAIPR